MRSLAGFALCAAMLTAPNTGRATSADAICGQTLASCEADLPQALMGGDAFRLVVAEPLPPMLAATFVGLVVTRKPQTSCLGPRAREALSSDQQGWLRQAGDVPSYDPDRTGVALLVAAPGVLIARECTIERLDGRTLAFDGDPIIVRRHAGSADIPASIAEVCGPAEESV